MDTRVPTGGLEGPSVGVQGFQRALKGFEGGSEDLRGLTRLIGPSEAYRGPEGPSEGLQGSRGPSEAYKRSRRSSEVLQVGTKGP